MGAGATGVGEGNGEGCAAGEAVDGLRGLSASEDILAALEEVDPTGQQGGGAGAGEEGEPERAMGCESQSAGSAANTITSRVEADAPVALTFTAADSPASGLPDTSRVEADAPGKQRLPHHTAEACRGPRSDHESVSGVSNGAGYPFFCTCFLMPYPFLHLFLDTLPFSAFVS